MAREEAHDVVLRYSTADDGLWLWCRTCGWERDIGWDPTPKLAVEQANEHQAEPDRTAALTFTCPQCGKTSHNPNDVRESYCGACHKFQAAP